MDPTSFAQRLKQARQQAGLSQQAVAERARLTAPYLSLLESGRRRPPSPAVIERLAAALGVKAQPWIEQAALERTPGPMRKRLEGLDRERGKVHKARDRILTTALYRLARHPGLMPGPGDYGGPDAGMLGSVLGRLAPKLRGLGSAREAQAQSEELLAPMGTAERDRLLEALPDLLPAAAGAPSAAPITRPLELRESLAPEAATLDLVHVDARWASPRAFLWRLEGDDAYPRLESGDWLLVDPDREPADGDLVAARVGGRDVARVLKRRGDEVRLEALRPDVPPLRVASGDWRPVGPIVRVLRATS